MSEVTENLLKVPVARLGRWHHPLYGIVSFSQNDFDDMIRNFEADELGFPPFMRYGHDVSPNGVVDAEPSRGSIVRLSQEGDVLFSYVVPTDDGAVEDVRSKRMRFASAELSRNVPSKHTGQNIGTVLKAIALTNSPFIPNLPNSEVLSNWVPAYPDNFSEEKLSTSTDVVDNEFFVLNLSQAIAEETVTDNNQDTGNTENVAAATTEATAEVQKLSSLTEKIYEQLSSFINLFKSREVAQTEGNEGQTATSAVEVENNNQETVEENDMSMTDNGQLQAAFEERLAALEAAQNERLAALETKLSNALTENETLRADLAAAQSTLASTSEKAEMFSHTLAEQRLADTKNRLVAAGIPPVLVENAFALVSNMAPVGEIKLSNGATGSLVDKMAEVLNTLPTENRVKYGQVGHTLSNNAVTENPYKDIINKMTKGN